jgi:hypothetical protein
MFYEILLCGLTLTLLFLVGVDWIKTSSRKHDPNEDSDDR